MTLSELVVIILIGVALIMAHTAGYEQGYSHGKRDQARWMYRYICEIARK